MRFRLALRGSLGRPLRRGVGAALVVSALAGLAACTTTTGPIIPTGEPNRYTLTSRSGGLTTSWVQLKSQALDRAREYCTSQNLKMTDPDVSSNHATGFTRPITYITFTCSPIPQPKDTQQDQNSQGK
ncbi:hypothetical protein CAL26_10080 [Bordetella genomosp. 9]|uniref:Lipoprotein n=1 Tax=Bordetella genomosp. 9 TaxID=1416803 RepID=A0A261RFF3_9BORD|nr:hypothetical protein [Bordetella genomosp. 9]OZI23768.1 hypothetical protein CAL26_10080 [Bordetella genomosp. 9]